MKLSEIDGKAALARACTLLETDPDAMTATLDAALAAPGLAIGMTGPPGVGKSTLAGALVRRFRAAGRTVGVLAIDPSSAVSGGALLGDRTRLSADPDPGLFRRSLAARTALGGLSDLAFPTLVLMRATLDVVLVETVGVGQSEIAVARQTDLTLLCVQPGAGDAIQFMKAGVLEVPDVVAVTKSDRPEAAATVAGLTAAFELGARAAPPVVPVSADAGTGLDALTAALFARPASSAARLAQARAWAAERVTAAFGRFGLAAVEETLSDGDSPFSSLVSALGSLRVVAEPRPTNR